MDYESELIGSDPTIVSLKNRLQKISQIGRTTLIAGPTGTGKELVAKALHSKSERRSAPFVSVHCGALPDSLFESELFGHSRGAFTGAMGSRDGLVRSAFGGTLFLDEVNSLPLSSQVKLLRFLESGEYRAIGSDITEQSNVWVVAATNEDLHERALEGTFRADLLYRLEVMRIDVPPLNTRGDDILLLADHFLNSASGGTKELTSGARQAILAYDWPGNIRELKHRVESAAFLTEARMIGEDALELELELDASVSFADYHDLDDARAPSLERQLWSLIEQSQMTLAEAIGLCESLLIRRALESEDENRTRAAAKLGIHVRTIFKKLAR